MKAKKRIAWLITLMLAMSAFSGCSDKVSEKATGENMEKGVISYPIETDETLKVWKILNGNISAQVPTENDIEFAKGLEKKTGIKVEYIHPPANQASEKFNTMISSGELPDIIEYQLSTTPEGIDGMIEGGYVKELDEQFLKDYSPNLWARLTEDNELRKWSVSQKGRYFGYPAYREDDSMTSFNGLVIRKDLLDKAGLDIPTTIDEWHDALVEFKNMGVEYPLSFRDVSTLFGKSGAFCGAYGVKADFYAEDGTIKYGPMEKAYKEFLETMHQWYEEGLIDNSFAAMDLAELDSKVLNAKVGASFGLIGSTLGKWISSQKGDADFKLAAVPYPTLKKGETPKFGYKDSRYNEPKYWITGTCKKPELAARFLDYGYSEEGQLYYNFGEEGKSYEMVDGKPTYTELITNNPEGLSATRALAKYTHASYLGPYMMDVDFYKQQYIYEEQQDAIDVWAATDAGKYYVYGMAELDVDDNAGYSRIMTEVNSYVREMTTKYIMGLESLENYKDFTSHLKSLKIEDAVKLRQKAYDKFLKK